MKHVCIINMVYITGGKISNRNDGQWVTNPDQKHLKAVI